MVYKWKDARQIKANANDAAVVMNQLAERGALTAQNLVEASKPIDAPLHNEFEWDDEKAASKYREHQARNIINALVIVPDENVPAKEPVRAYFQIEDGGKRYTQLTAIMESPTQMEMLLKSALNELAAFKKKYGLLQELQDVIKSIDETQIMYG